MGIWVHKDGCGLMQNKDIRQLRQAQRGAVQRCGLMQNKDIRQFAWMTATSPLVVV